MAYIIDRKEKKTDISFMPVTDIFLSNGLRCELDYLVQPDDIEQTRTIFNIVIEEGQTYPQLNVHDPEQFRAYYMSHDAFVLKSCEDAHGFRRGEVVGAFYIKPNYPGRCSHICNGGFLVKPEARRLGAGSRMAEKFLWLGKALGYRASVFNLVFETNTASVRLWEKLGFTHVGTIPKAGNLKGLGYTDARVYHYDFDNVQLPSPMQQSRS